MIFEVMEVVGVVNIVFLLFVVVFGIFDVFFVVEDMVKKLVSFYGEFKFIGEWLLCD